ncbi:hypothetical protein IFM89_039527 [Coptis chinensis]|uniref:Uncharacterized protein n=1 Tax=Coptis chinensis TaxID=261450 RepID=A0A835GTH2_9MAGN|nr:hypothetical protein IFM89_039527 [Coptis chinensis]
MVLKSQIQRPHHQLTTSVSSTTNIMARSSPTSPDERPVLKPQFFREVYKGSPDVYSSQFPLAPPLPKSPSESWLWCTLPSVSSKNSATFHSRKQCSKPPSVDQTWETIVKTSNVSEVISFSSNLLEIEVYKLANVVYSLFIHLLGWSILMTSHFLLL